MSNSFHQFPGADLVTECTLAQESLDPASEYAAFLNSCNGAGAVASFTGMTRDKASDGSVVDSLHLDHHPCMTLASLEAIASAAKARFTIDRLRIVHRCGHVPVGEPIVFVAAASAHRRAALEAVDYMMDRLKTDAVFWKREDRSDGSAWIEPTAADHESRARWGADYGRH